MVKQAVKVIVENLPRAIISHLGRALNGDPDPASLGSPQESTQFVEALKERGLSPEDLETLRQNGIAIDDLSFSSYEEI